MIDLSNETTLSLTAACRRLPSSRQGRPVSLSCVLQWVLTGSASPTGERVRLEAVRLGGKWITSLEALQRFTERLTPQLDSPPASTPRTPGRRQRASERAARELKKIGI